MRVVASSSSPSTTRAPAHAADEAQAGGEALLADRRGDAVDPLRPEPRLGQRGGDHEGVGHAALVERVGELLLAVALGERVEALARPRLLGRLGAERDERRELSGGGAGRRDLGEGGRALALVARAASRPPARRRRPGC